VPYPHINPKSFIDVHACVHSVHAAYTPRERLSFFWVMGACVDPNGMSKQHMSARVPENVREDIERIQDEQGIDDQSEAMRQVLQQGVRSFEPDRTPGETLGQQATTVAGVGWVVATIGVLTGQAWAVSLVMPFALATFVFCVLWASVRVLAGRRFL